MVGYAQYSRDARVKSYVRTLTQRGAAVDVIVLEEPGKSRTETIGSARILHLSRQYRGTSRWRYLASYLSFFVKALFTVTHLSLRRRYAVVHVHNMPNLIVLTAIVPRILGARVILDVHDLMMANYMAKFGVGSDHIAVKCLIAEQRVSALIASHVICADDLQKEYLVSRCGIAESKITVMLNLPNEQTFKHQASERAQGDPFRLVYHGTIAHRLGIDLLLHAVLRIRDRIPVHLSIFGAGDFLSEAVKLADELGLNGHVYFNESFFPVEQVPAFVGGMDVGVIGNRRNLACDRFMLPVKLLEYVYLGIPVVAPRLTIIEHYFDDDMLGFYEPEDVSDLAEKILELYRSAELRKRRVANARRFYERRSWSIQSERYWALVRGIRVPTPVAVTDHTQSAR
jgi:glycosyltransferase involved in cell wall biosynthesis